MTRRVILLILLVIVIACLLTLFVSYNYDNIFSEDMSRYVPIWWVGNSFGGQVVSFDGGVLVVQNQDTKETKSFLVQPGATRTVLAGAEPLSKGMMVKVTYKQSTQALLAKSVREMRKTAGSQAPGAPAQPGSETTSPAAPAPEKTGAPSPEKTGAGMPANPEASPAATGGATEPGQAPAGQGSPMGQPTGQPMGTPAGEQPASPSTP